MKIILQIYSKMKEFCIIWKDLTLYRYSIFNNKSFVILNEINGLAEFGTLTAVMGPSGSGLTSLLKCLNGFNGIIDSYLSEGSKIFSNKKFKISSTFIDNNEKDYLIMGLTVKQNLMYASKLKNSLIEGFVDHKTNVKTVMSELMISDVANNTTKKCSGGELKRLAIAMELIAIDKPNLVLIDEPTTGLDSHVASVVCLCNMQFSYEDVHIHLLADFVLFRMFKFLLNRECVL